MMSFPAADPLAALGAPLASSVSFVVAPAVIAMGLALGVLILAVCAVTLFARASNRVVAQLLRTPQIARPSIGTGGVHQ